MSKTITATELARNLADYLNRVSYRGESFVVQRGGRPVAELRPPPRGIRARRAAFVEALLDEFPVLAIDLAIARAHAQLWAPLASAGRLIGPHDLWLAATCIGRDLGLLTVNRREFERVPGLRVECWK